MSIYLWKIPEIPNKYICTCDYERFSDWLDFSDGRSLLDRKTEEIPIFSVKVSKEKLRELDCLPNNGSCPIVNERVATMLKEMAPDDVEFFKVKIVCTDGVFLNYQLMNVTHAIECIDREKSIYYKMIPDDEVIGGYKKPIYKLDCMGNNSLVRDKDMKSQLLVNQNVYDRFQKEHIKGALLITPYEYYKELYPQYY